MKRNAQKKYVICVRNKGHEASLEIGKVYRQLPDKEGAKLHYIRVIDEFEEDYLFPAKNFSPIKVPLFVQRQLAHAFA